MNIKTIANNIIASTFLLLALPANSQPLSFLSDNSSLTQPDKPLSVDEAFVSEINDLDNKVEFLFDIKPNHYLYKQKMEVYYNNKKQDIELHDGKIIHDEFFGESEIYEYGFSFATEKTFSKDTNVKISYQGCSKLFNLCYPVKTKEVLIKGNPNAIEIEETVSKLDNKEEKETLSITEFNNLANTNDTNDIVKLIKDYKNSILIYLIFFVLGIFIAFTPCIYPLMPVVIASTYGAKNKKIATISYIFGMVISYSIIGLLTGFLDFNLQIYAQNKYVLYGISGVLIFLALYMLGFINFLLPSHFNEEISNKINKINPDKYSNQVVIGFLSSLVMSPCSVAPLLGVLIFINQIGEPIFGASLLASMAIGIGVPIFLLSTSLNKFMPKNGAWMNEMKNILAIFIICIVVYLLKFNFSEIVYYSLYSFIFLLYGLHLLSLDTRKKIGVLLFTFGFLLANYNITKQNSFGNNIINEAEKVHYEEITNLKDLEEFIENSDRPIFIDYYADWCVSCVRMENTTLKNPTIIKQLNNNYFMVKIDLTDITPEKQNIMDTKNILAIPYYSIIDKDKNEYIYTGELKEVDFNKILIKYSG